MATAFEALTKAPCAKCPICLELFRVTEPRVMCPCGHIFHGECLEADGSAHEQRCGLCRKPTHQRLRLRCRAIEGGPAEVTLKPVKFRPQSGEQRTSSKFAELTAVLLGLVEDWRASAGATGKVLVLVQWCELRAKLEEAFRADGIRFVAHKGQVTEARENLKSFLSEAVDSPVVLVATFERRLRFNIQHVAAHVVLVHPCVASGAHTDDTLTLGPEQTEEQAFALVVRPGQLRDVHIHRFVGADTVEEGMVAAKPKPWHRSELREA